jgi:hypothetical protein
MTTRDKLKFLQYTFIQQLRGIDASTKPIFGKMNVHQMVEHFTWAVQIANGKVVLEAPTDEALIEKAMDFLHGEKMFKDNTPNKLLGEEPAKTTTASIGDAIDNLEDELADFVDVFKKTAGLKFAHPAFGMLDWYDQVQLLYKHAVHHTRQFGIKN